ncbi:Long-chain-fatty-acid--CoA ligase 2 [Psilocybe cubensis]|uniref:Long-chain-fatty-acid--CoA ligase 2 n=1 Tax=Psilocybe cubensis TaxID=181762 RepID=A0ACB8GMW8_PSICU|nr:Long-chain-fatty-acid--CoA ligase 2 [Psilocybe cubensis]KAH9476805.1 Long-chain-fatty-acid--CoA ligase 2 [Psilocybe cubensis]
MAHVRTNKPGYYGPGSVEISPPTKPGEGPTRRCRLAEAGLVERPLDGINTVYDVITYASEKHGNRKALGWRDVVKIVEEEKEVKKVIDGKEVTQKKIWKYFELTDYKYISFIELEEAVSEVARALVHLGITGGDVFNVYAQTSPNWQIMAHAIVSISVIMATSYDTLGEDGLAHSLNEPECVALFTNAELLPTLHRVLAKTPTIKYIVFDGEPSQAVIDDLHSVRETLKIFSLDKLREIGRTLSTETLRGRRPKPDDLAMIMYTSGSTGPPKGVCITHSNLIASVGAVYVLIGHHLTYDDSYLAYLPLAHVMEYMVELTILFVGMPSGYGRVKTLTDASVRNCKGDICAFRPSIMVGVPDVWETIRKGIQTKVNNSGFIKKGIFDSAMAAKKHNIPLFAQLADSIVLGGVRAATGGRLRIAMSGGAAISQETQEFLSTALVTIIQGYGMTESCGMCAILPPELMRYCSVGLPVPSVDIKLRDVPDAGYFSSNEVQQGEICIRGPSVVAGYYKRPDLNSDETIFTKDGWLRTGDVGQWNADGTLSVIDRVKNLIKLATGEYIALERLESIYRSCNLVANICVLALPDAKQPVAVIIPHEGNIRLVLKAHDVDATAEFSELCKQHLVQEIIRTECNNVGKRNGFKPMELLQAVILTSDEWTPENGFVTAARKIQRSKISNVFKNQIVVWPVA